MFKAVASVTMKGYHPSSQWTSYNDAVITRAETHKELLEKLRAFYGKAWNHKRPMYCDKKDGSKVRTGWVVGFRVDNGLGEKYLQQDWVSVVEEQQVTW